MVKRTNDNFALFQKEKVNNETRRLGDKRILLTDRDEVAENLWKRCLTIIKDNVSSQVYTTWFKPIRAHTWKDKQLTLLVPSQFFYEWIEEHYFSLLQKTIAKVLGENARLQYEIVVEENGESLEQRTIKIPALRYPPSGIQGTLTFNKTGEENKPYHTWLNPRYSFDNFIMGDSNQLAFSAGKAVSQKPGSTRYNPLVIYGDTGLGKTHLVQAIGNDIVRENPRLKVLYTNSERFTMDFVNSIQNNQQTEFINFYRNIDVLVVDDIQFFSGKEKTQDNFFHTFNALHQAGKQLVLTSDRPPKELKDVDDRLISRFQWGLTVDIQKPDLETRMAILQRKSKDEGMELPVEIIEYIAKNVTSSIRELEGTLISLIAKVTLDRRELSLELSKEVIHGIALTEPKPLTIDDIKEKVSKYYNIPIDIIESKSRKHEIALSRQMCMYLAKKNTNLSLKSIGSHFGGRDHSTVLHSCQTIDNYVETDPKVRKDLETLQARVKISNS